jgi:hypothetical protein
LSPADTVVLAHPKAVKSTTAIRAKADKIDASGLATLLTGSFLPELWMADEQTPRLRR